MKYFVRHDGFRFSSIVIVFLFLSAIIFGGKPVINISSSAISPRLSAIEDDEQIHWRTLLNYNQEFSNLLKIESLVEFGSENDRLENSFRIHHLVATFDLRNHELSVGRIAKWNSMVNARIDGAEAKLNFNKYGLVSLLGGFEAVTDFSDTAFADKTFLMASWNIGKLGKNISVSYWSKGLDNEYNSFIGISFSTAVFGFRINNTSTYDIDESRIQYQRSRVSRKIGKHTLAVGLRQKRYNGLELYPWSNEEIELAPTMFLTVYSKLNQKFNWYNQYAHKSSNSLDYFNSTIQYDKYSLTFSGGKMEDTQLIGFVLGVADHSCGKFGYGGSIAVNALDYGDFAEPRNATGLFGWISWQPKPMINLKLFGRYSTNSYYRQDGRGGIIINVAI